MGEYYRRARLDADKIRYYRDNARVDGYKQAEPYFHKLQSLLRSAGNSKNDKRDVIPIQALLATARKHMQEMAERESASAPSADPQ